MNGLINYSASPYRGKQVQSKYRPVPPYPPTAAAAAGVSADDCSDTSSYVHGSHEDVLWSLEQQVNTMSKYGVVANSVEFQELERSLDEELKKYQIGDERDTRDDTLLTMNTSELVHDGHGTGSDSPPSSPDDILNSKPSDIDLLYKGFYRDNASADRSPFRPASSEFRAPSDLDYYPTKQTPKIYPKSPKPAPKSYGSSSALPFSSSIYNRGPSTRDTDRQPHTSCSLRSLASNSAHSSRAVSRSRSRQGSEAGSCCDGGDNSNTCHGTGGYATPLPYTNGDHSSSSTAAAVYHKELNKPPAWDPAISPPLASRGYASSMPVLDSENIEPNKQAAAAHTDSNKLMGARTISQISEATTRTTNLSRASLHKRRPSVNNKSRQCSDNQSAGGSSVSSEPELHDILNILTTSSNLSLVNTAAGALQHLSFNQDDMKTKIREAGAIPILIHLLSLDDLVCISSLGVLRNMSFGRNNHLNRIAIQDAHGITLLVQLLNTTESFEIQELVTGVFWNLSSSDTLKLPILKQALEPLVKNIIIPQSGWKESLGIAFDELSYSSSCNINWTTVFRNATGCLKNLSSAGVEGRTMLRLCSGLVDSLLWTVRSAQGKNDVDNKAVENAVCILRNLSYRLEAEVTPDTKYGQTEDWRSRGLGGGQFRQNKKKKVGKKKEVPFATPLPEHTAGVGLLWQPSVVRVYLDLLLECSNPETLEGAAGALQNLTACTWQPAQEIRETVRKEKGLSVITSLLRLPNDLVVRATAFCLRNLALDVKNKDLLGRHATHDLVKRLPGGDGADGITDMTISGIVAAIVEIVTDSPDNARICRDCDGVSRLLEIARSQDVYTRQCVLTSNRILAIFWELKDIRRQLKSLGWNVSYYTRLQSMDRSDGMEYDETRNQFRITSGTPNEGAHYQNPDMLKSPDPTFDSHTMQAHASPPDVTSPLTNVTSSPSHVITSPSHVITSPEYGASQQQGRSSTLGRSFEHPLHHPNNPNRSYQDLQPELPPRGHSTLPSRNPPVLVSRNPHSSKYSVADSWV